MKLNKSILWPILALLVVVAIAFALTRSTNDEPEETDQTQVFIQDPNPDASPRDPRDIADETPAEPEPSVGGSNTEAPSNDGKVLGETEDKPRTPASPPVPRTPEPTTNTVRYSSVGLEVTMPNTWQVKTEQNNRGNVIVFYSQNSIFGSIEVATGYQSLQQYQNELSADYSVTSLKTAILSGHTALVYTKSGSNNLYYAIYVNGRLYILTGNPLLDRFNSIRFF